MTKLKLFFGSLITTTCVLLTIIYVNRPESAKAGAPKLIPVFGYAYITSQLKPQDMLDMKQRRITTVIDLRPDGEEKDQPTSSQMAQAAKDNNLSFYYIPIPHETIPADAVDQLGKALSENHNSNVLYCRSGRRAARTLALVEASRSSRYRITADILQEIHDAGFSAEDLKEEITRRIVEQKNILKEKK